MSRTSVAFTPKGGCPLKLQQHARGEVPQRDVAFTPKGGCPLKPGSSYNANQRPPVAFTPKGGCPLKPHAPYAEEFVDPLRSIHPQGWVPIETRLEQYLERDACV